MCVGTIFGTHDNVIVPEDGACLIEGPGTRINGNVTALPGSSLIIQGGVFVKGNVTALADSFLSIRGNQVRALTTEIGGDVIGDKADYVELTFFTNIVHGDIHVSGRGDVPQSGVNLCGVTLPNGNIEVEKMTVSFGIFVDISFCSGLVILDNGSIKLEDNHVLAGARLNVGNAQIANGNLHVFKNKGQGSKTVMGNNVMKGDIQCYENDPVFVGGPNMGRAPKSVPVIPPTVPPTTAPNQCSGTPT